MNETNLRLPFRCYDLGVMGAAQEEMSTEASRSMRPGALSLPDDDLDEDDDLASEALDWPIKTSAEVVRAYLGTVPKMTSKTVRIWR